MPNLQIPPFNIILRLATDSEKANPLQAQRGGNRQQKEVGIYQSRQHLLNGPTLFNAKIKQLKFAVPFRSQIYNYIHLVQCGIIIKYRL
jgi:hypothetical protein